MAAYTQGQQLWAIPVAAGMAQKLIACHASDSISEAEELMRDNLVRRLPVLDQNEHLVGILSLNDIAREAQRQASGSKGAEVTGGGGEDPSFALSASLVARNRCISLSDAAICRKCRGAKAGVSLTGNTRCNDEIKDG